jgi:hypothetical protein
MRRGSLDDAVLHVCSPNSQYQEGISARWWMRRRHVPGRHVRHEYELKRVRLLDQERGCVAPRSPLSVINLVLVGHRVLLAALVGRAGKSTLKNPSCPSKNLPYRSTGFAGVLRNEIFGDAVVRTKTLNNHAVRDG